MSKEKENEIVESQEKRVDCCDNKKCKNYKAKHPNHCNLFKDYVDLKADCDSFIT